MNKTRFLFFVAAVAFGSQGFGSQANASLIDLRAPLLEDLDGGPSVVLRDGGITVTLSTGDGVFNRTASGFGINAPGGSDDADGIDGGRVAESLDVLFDSAVRLNAITLSKLSGADRAWLRIGTRELNFTRSGRHLLGGSLLGFGTVLRVGHGAGNGFSLDALEFGSVIAAAPGTMPLLIAPLAVLALARNIRTLPFTRGLKRPHVGQ